MSDRLYTASKYATNIYINTFLDSYIFDTLLLEYDILAVFVSGSRLAATATLGSDYDLVFVVSGTVPDARLNKETLSYIRFADGTKLH